MNKRLPIQLAVGLIIIIALIAGGYFYFISKDNQIPIQDHPIEIQQQSLIFGEWFPLDTGSSGLGSGFTFTSSGEVISKFGAYVSFKYKLEGDILTYIFPEEETSESIQKIKMDDSKMAITYSNGKEEKLTHGGGSHDGIIGRWIGDHYTGGQQIMWFTASQDAYLSVSMTSQSGTYEVDGETVKLSGEVSGSWQWLVENNTLTLTSNDEEKTKKYVKLQ